MRLAVLIGEVLPPTVIEALRTLPESVELLIWMDGDGPATCLNLPSARFLPGWDTLLTERLDAALLCGASRELQTAAHQLAHHNLKLLIPVEATSSPARLFDFMSIWQEHPHALIPIYLSGVEQAADAAFQEFRHQECGTLWKLEFHRILTRSAAENPLCSSDQIDRTLLQDLHWICRHTSFPQHVTMQYSGRAGDPAEIIVLLGGAQTPEVRWSLVCRAQEQDQWSLTLNGSSGAISWSDRSPLSTSTGSSFPAAEDPPGAPFGSPGLEPRRGSDLLRQIRQWTQAPVKSASPSPWKGLIQLAEIGAVARRSLLRRRTLDVYFGEASERTQFKSQMTALGCGALLWTIFGMISLLTLGGMIDPRDREYRQSAAAGFLVPPEQFSPGSDVLTPAGREHLQAISARWSETTPVLIVEDSPRVENSVNQSRKETVLRELSANGVHDASGRLVLRPLRGKWFGAIMRAGWFVVFAPLAVVLLLQLLILASRDRGTAS